MSDQERDERSDESSEEEEMSGESSEEEEMSADPGGAEEGGDTEAEEEPLSEYKPKPLSGY